MEITLQSRGRSRLWRRLGLFMGGLALLAALAVSGGSPAAEAAELSRTGQIGRFVITDRAANPGAGARCIYQPDGRLNRLIVGGPSVFARDATLALNVQTVTYTATLLRVCPGGGVTAVESSPLQQLQAADVASARFNAVTFTMLNRPTGAYVINRVIGWRSFANPNLVDGSVVVRQDHYAVDLERAPRSFVNRGSTTDGCFTPLPVTSPIIGG